MLAHRLKDPNMNDARVSSVEDTDSEILGIEVDVDSESGAEVDAESAIESTLRSSMITQGPQPAYKQSNHSPAKSMHRAADETMGSRRLSTTSTSSKNVAIFNLRSIQV